MGVPYYGRLSGLGFETIAFLEIPTLVGCLHPNNSLMRKVRCTSQSQIFGWSFYDLQLSLWFNYFSPRDLLVTYIDDLERDPLFVMRSIERHLGLQCHDYGDALHNVYNARGAGHGDVQTVPGQQFNSSLVATERCTKLGIDAMICGALYKLF